MKRKLMPSASLLQPKAKPTKKAPKANVTSHVYNWRSRAGLKRGK